MRFIQVSFFFLFGSVSINTHTTDDFLGPIQCLEQRLTREACDLVFCPPWKYCVHGVCSCKPPYLCSSDQVTPVCSHGNRTLLSYCQAMAFSCRTKAPEMSHFSDTCTGEQPMFKTRIEKHVEVVQVFVPGGANNKGEELLVCEELWDMAAANVVCREAGHPHGALTAETVSHTSLTSQQGYTPPHRCVSVRCQGYESSLAECAIFDKTDTNNRRVATATCWPPTGNLCDFRCVNGKCVSVPQTCDGVDDCGDRSDEMCCKKCRGDAFRCSTGVCLHRESVGDGVLDCLDGADEAARHTATKTSNSLPMSTEYISPKKEVRASRVKMESRLSCGVSTSAEDLMSSRVERVVGGIPAGKTQIQWQVSITKSGRFYCGGAYLGDCWVITTAHCIRPPSESTTEEPHSQPKPNLATLKVKLSLWRRHSVQASTDIALVEDVHIHPDFNPKTLQNDIALVQMRRYHSSGACLSDNPSITPICVPWSPKLFQPNHTCTISGWGQTAGGRSSSVLQWANVTLIHDCQRFYGESFRPGMTCAGELGGQVDSCHGDSGGPLVCQDELGVSYLWGIVSGGRKCGHEDSPGLYTEIAHFFEWIRGHTGSAAVTKFNS